MKTAADIITKRAKVPQANMRRQFVDIFLNTRWWNTLLTSYKLFLAKRSSEKFSEDGFARNNL